MAEGGAEAGKWDSLSVRGAKRLPPLNVVSISVRRALGSWLGSLGGGW